MVTTEETSDVKIADTFTVRMIMKIRCRYAELLDIVFPIKEKIVHRAHKKPYQMRRVIKSICLSSIILKFR